MSDDLSEFFFTPGTVYRRDTYPYINPSRPGLSTKGRTAIVTGAGSGIGASIAQSLARSGIAALGLVGRTEATLQRTKDSIAAIAPGTRVLTYAADIVDADAVTGALSSFAAAVGGKIDILVANAGYMADLASITDADPTDWWRGFEINVRGNFNLCRAFAAHAAPGGVAVHVSSSAVYIPYMPGYSSYRGSKAGATKVFEYFAEEMKERGDGVTVVQVHPGLIRTGMSVKFGASADGMPYDSVELSGDFVNWLVSDEARFLRGRFVAANWDAEELLQMREKIEGDKRLFTMNLVSA